MKKSVHVLRYGTVAEKNHLEKAISAYDYLSINGNTAAYVSNAISQFIVDKFFDNPEKGFFIDPITYAFQQDIRLLSSKSKTTGAVQIKKSIDKLIEIYQEPITKIRQGEAVTTDDFSDNTICKIFCEKVLNFQYNLVYDHIEKNNLSKYIEFITNDNLHENTQLFPKFLIAPYFYLNSHDGNFKEWVELNCKFIDLSFEKAKKDFNDLPVYGQIVINKNVLKDTNALKTIASQYNNTKCIGFTIWVDDFNEHEATLEELTGFVNFISRLQARPIYNMYGGYFSILLTNKDVNLLSGVSHGLEYGESRAVYPVGGGIPVSKYYFLPLHKRIDFTKAFYLLESTEVIKPNLNNWGDSKKYYKEICRCYQCKKVIEKDMINFIEFESREFYEIHKKNQVLRRKKASASTKMNCLYHYLLCKKMEFLNVNKKTMRELINDLKIQKEHYEKCKATEINELEYLDMWAYVLQDYEDRKNGQ